MLCSIASMKRLRYIACTLGCEQGYLTDIIVPYPRKLSMILQDPHKYPWLFADSDITGQDT